LRTFFSSSINAGEVSGFAAASALSIIAMASFGLPAASKYRAFA